MMNERRAINIIFNPFISKIYNTKYHQQEPMGSFGISFIYENSLLVQKKKKRTKKHSYKIRSNIRVHHIFVTYEKKIYVRGKKIHTFLYSYDVFTYVTYVDVYSE